MSTDRPVRQGVALLVAVSIKSLAIKDRLRASGLALVSDAVPTD
jgi:hypothetical protein